MKKFLWFLVGMAIIISVPILLFNREAPLKKVTPQSLTSQSEIPKGTTTQGVPQQGVISQGATSTGVTSKEPLLKGKEIQKDQGQKPGSFTDLKGTSIKGDAGKYKGPPSNTAGKE